jgi:hypothetical protein
MAVLQNLGFSYLLSDAVKYVEVLHERQVIGTDDLKVVRSWKFVPGDTQSALIVSAPQGISYKWEAQSKYAAVILTRAEVNSLVELDRSNSIAIRINWIVFDFTAPSSPMPLKPTLDDLRSELKPWIEKESRGIRPRFAVITLDDLPLNDLGDFEQVIGPSSLEEMFEQLLSRTKSVPV